MSRSERLLLLVFFAAVLVFLAGRELTAALVGALVAAVPAALLAARLKRLGARMDTRLGVVEERRRGLRPWAVTVRALVHLVVLGALLLTTLFVPFVGGELFAALAAFVTSGAAVLTAARVRR